MEFRREGSVQGYYCKTCDWAVVTTYIPPEQLDETKYQVRVLSGDLHNENHVRAVATVSGRNFIQARQLLQQQTPIVFEGLAVDVLKAREALNTAGVRYEIEPTFNY